MAMLIVALVVPFLAAYLALGACCPGRWLRACLAFALAAGLSSCAFFVWLSVGPSAWPLAGAEGLITLGALTALFLWRPRKIAPTPPAAPLAGMPLFLLLALGAAFACSAARFVIIVGKGPHGDFDAWCIWNLRARFLARGGDHWADAFQVPVQFWAHPDYPLLVPGLVARGWLYLGREATFVPALLAGLFAAATAGLLVAAVARMRGLTQGLLAGLALLGTTALTELGSAQYADVPLGLFVLAATALCCLHDRAPERDGRLLLVAGLATGFAAWTKNEGLLFAAAAAAARAVLGLRQGRRGLREAGWFAGGLLPVLLLVVYFKVRYAPPSEFAAVGGAVASRLADASRYRQIAASFASELRHVARWQLIALAGGLALLRRAPNRRGTAFPALVLGLMLLGYGGVYAASPYDLGWHLYHSVGRLLMHLWPTALLTYFLGVATPEEALARPARRPAPTPVPEPARRAA